MYNCAAVAVVHVLQALVYIYLANKNSYFTWGAFFFASICDVPLHCFAPFYDLCCFRQSSPPVSRASHWLGRVVLLKEGNSQSCS